MKIYISCSKRNEPYSYKKKSLPTISLVPTFFLLKFWTMPPLIHPLSHPLNMPLSTSYLYLSNDKI